MRSIFYPRPRTRLSYRAIDDVPVHLRHVLDAQDHLVTEPPGDRRVRGLMEALLTTSKNSFVDITDTIQANIPYLFFHLYALQYVVEHNPFPHVLVDGMKHYLDPRLVVMIFGQTLDELSTVDSDEIRRKLVLLDGMCFIMELRGDWIEYMKSIHPALASSLYDCYTSIEFQNLVDTRPPNKSVGELLYDVVTAAKDEFILTVPQSSKETFQNIRTILIGRDEYCLNPHGVSDYFQNMTTTMFLICMKMTRVKTLNGVDFFTLSKWSIPKNASVAEARFVAVLLSIDEDYSDRAAGTAHANILMYDGMLPEKSRLLFFEPWGECHTTEQFGPMFDAERLFLMQVRDGLEQISTQKSIDLDNFIHEISSACSDMSRKTCSSRHVWHVLGVDDGYTCKSGFRGLQRIMVPEDRGYCLASVLLLLYIIVMNQRHITDKSVYTRIIDSYLYLMILTRSMSEVVFRFQHAVVEAVEMMRCKLNPQHSKEYCEHQYAILHADEIERLRAQKKEIQTLKEGLFRRILHVRPQTLENERTMKLYKDQIDSIQALIHALHQGVADSDPDAFRRIQERYEALVSANAAKHERFFQTMDATVS